MSRKLWCGYTYTLAFTVYKMDLNNLEDQRVSIFKSTIVEDSHEM